MANTRTMLLATTILLAGCATITKGTDQTVTLDTPGHPGSVCTLTSEGIGSRQVTTPANINLPKSKHDISVSCVRGCYAGTTIITSNLEGMTAGNILVGGVIGLGVDSASGAMNKYGAYNQVVMQPNVNCVPQQITPSP